MGCFQAPPAMAENGPLKRPIKRSMKNPIMRNVWYSASRAPWIWKHHPHRNSFKQVVSHSNFVFSQFFCKSRVSNIIFALPSKQIWHTQDVQRQFCNFYHLMSANKSYGIAKNLGSMVNTSFVFRVLSTVDREWPRYCRKARWTKMVQTAILVKMTLFRTGF